MLGSLGASLWKQRPESFDSDVDRESVVRSLKDKENLKNILEPESRPRPSEEREWLSKNCMKLRLKLSQEIGEKGRFSGDQARI